MIKKQNSVRELAFTLVELLVVIAILGILATVGLVAFNSSQIRGRDAQRKSDLKQTSSALEIYYNDYGRYPASNDDGKIMGCPTTVPTACNWDNDDQFTDGKTVYLKSVAEDPSSGLNYFYHTESGQSYTLYAHLENSQDSGINTILDAPSCGGTSLCNFYIESSNGELE